MKKIFLTIGFLSIFFSGSEIALAAETCNWEVLTISTGGSTYGGTSSQTGGCDAKKLTKSNEAKCKSKTEPSHSAVLGQVIECCCSGSAAVAEKPTLFTMPDFQVEIPGLKKLADVSCQPNQDCAIPWIGEYTKGIYNYLLAIVGVIASIVLMAGGVIWLTSGGDSGKVGQAKDLILGAIIGMIILICSYLLLNQINPGLVNLQNINVKTVKKIEVHADADITVVGGPRAYGDGCAASKKGDWSVCAAYKETPPAGLVNIERVKANSGVAAKYTAAMECVKAKNGKYLFYINEAWRSPAKQIEYKTKSNNNGGSPVTADPCCSNHGAGYALDINRIDGASMDWKYNETSGLKKCMEDQEMYAKLTSEPWHWSPTGR